MAVAYRINFTGAQETPANSSTAFGAGVFVWDPVSVTGTYYGRIEGLTFVSTATSTTPAITAIHFHSQVRGTAGAVVFGQIGPANDSEFTTSQNADGSWNASGRWDVSDGGQ